MTSAVPTRSVTACYRRRRCLASSMAIQLSRQNVSQYGRHSSVISSTALKSSLTRSSPQAKVRVYMCMSACLYVCTPACLYVCTPACLYV